MPQARHRHHLRFLAAAQRRMEPRGQPAAQQANRTGVQGTAGAATWLVSHCAARAAAGTDGAVRIRIAIVSATAAAAASAGAQPPTTAAAATEKNPASPAP